MSGTKVSSRELVLFCTEFHEDDKRLCSVSLGMVISDRERKQAGGGTKKAFICFAVLPKPQTGLGLHWLRAVKDVNANKGSALKSLQTSTGSRKGYKHQVPKQ